MDYRDYDYNDPKLLPLDFMLAVMRSSHLPMAIRVYAAEGAGPYLTHEERVRMEEMIRKRASIIPGCTITRERASRVRA